MRMFGTYEKGEFEPVTHFTNLAFFMIIAFILMFAYEEVKSINKKLAASQYYQSAVCTLLDSNANEFSPDAKQLSCQITGDRLSNAEGASTTANLVSLDDLYRNHWRVVTSSTRHTPEAEHIIYIIEKKQ